LKKKAKNTTETEYFIQIEAYKSGEKKGKFNKKCKSESIRSGDLDGNDVIELYDDDAILSLKINASIQYQTEFL